MAEPDLVALLARIEDLEDLLSVYEAHLDDRTIPWSAVKAAVGLTP